MSVYPYLVVPGSTVISLPGPTGNIEVNVSRSDTVHTLIGGGTTVTRRKGSKKSYSLPYSSRPGVGVDDLLWSIYRGVYGDGPFVFVDPSANNVLSLDQSTFGVRTGADDGWTVNTGSIVADGSTAPPAGVASVSALWVTPAAAQFMMPGSSTTTADTTSAAMYIPAEWTCFSIYLKATGACTVTLALRNYDANTGASLGLLGNTTVTPTSSWARYFYALAPGASAEMVVPRVTLASGTPSDVWFAGPQLEYAQFPSLWCAGYGAARVLVTAAPDKAIQKWGWSDLTLALAEV